MKTASIADLRNEFRRVSSWLDNGEPVEILRRGKPYARLVPVGKARESTVAVDFAAQRRRIWKGRRFSAAEIAHMDTAARDRELP